MAQFVSVSRIFVLEPNKFVITKSTLYWPSHKIMKIFELRRILSRKEKKKRGNPPKYLSNYVTKSHWPNLVL